ncbi:MAG: hypothetical protein EZS28_004407 [Streblomastix strix]|uniref:Uncharacterized protein n=1 Tax=Streblomastix strix TaxID=222440 RepID=A0A5J4WY90_9EUKA|nr:MAG: hypothetical protein EZS28_004407 [Streblomastix strix]
MYDAEQQRKRFTYAEYDDLIKEIGSQCSPEDPKKKKLASAESNEVDSKGKKKKKNKNGDEDDDEYVLKIPMSRFKDYKPKYVIEPPPVIIMRKKNR